MVSTCLLHPPFAIMPLSLMSERGLQENPVKLGSGKKVCGINLQLFLNFK